MSTDDRANQSANVESNANTGTTAAPLEVSSASPFNSWATVLASALLASPDVTIITDANATILWVNAAFTRCTGYSAQEAIGNTPRILRSGAQDRPFYKALWKTILAGEVWHGELVNRRKNGSLYNEEMTIIPVRSSAGQIVNFVAVKHDFTLRALYEEQVRLYTAELEQAHVEQERHARQLSHLIDEIGKSETSFRVLFNVIPQPVYVFDRETLQFLEVNDACLKSYGYSRDELLKMKIIDLRPQEEIPRMRQTLAQSGPMSVLSSPFKHRVRDGRILDMEVSTHSCEFAGKNAALSVALDVTEKNRLEMELRHSQKLEAVGSLAAGIAHEINTPIQFVGDNLRFLLDEFAGVSRLVDKYRELERAAALGAVSPDLLNEVHEAYQASDWDYLLSEVPRAMNQTLEGIARVATIVRAMKAFSHPDRGERVPTDINAGLQTTLIVARNELKYVAEVETDFGDLPQVSCYPGDLNQVFLNLLVNAAHAIQDAVKDSGRKGKIKVVSRAEDGFVSINISDTGTGIPESIRDRIFEPFFTTKEVGRGTGQGLALAHSIIVDKHGGSLTFESQVGVGTTFTIHLPIAPPNTDLAQGM